MDISSYRVNERLATATVPSWRMRAMHRPHLFHTSGFPVQVDTTDELVPLLDTMQENLFGSFVKELGGLNEADLKAFVDSLVEYCLFFRPNLPGQGASSRRSPPPADTVVPRIRR